MVILILLGIVAIVLLIVCIICCVGNSKLKKYTTEDSCIVFGKKGKGKSLLFSKIARNSKKHGYISNTDFKFGWGTVIDPIDIECGNSWLNFLNGNIVKQEKKPNFEKHTVLLDDAGVYLPNFMDTTLSKKFPSMPVSFAVWRHLYDAPIHINCQACDRVWKLLREQATYYIRVKGVTKLFGFGFIRWTIYDRHEAAEREIEPLKGVLMNKYSKADVLNFKANNGLVKNYMVCVRFRNHKYDSRYFHNVVFGEPAPKSKNLLQIIKNKFKLKARKEITQNGSNSNS